MRWETAISDRSSPVEAIQEAIAQVRAGLQSEDPDLVVMFVSPHHAGGIEAIGAQVRAEWPAAVLAGCMGGGIIGGNREIEHQPAISLLAGVLPDVAVVPFHVDEAALSGIGDSPDSWHERLDLVPEQQPAFVLLPDPFTCDVETLVQSLDSAFPGSPKIGGLTSGAQAPGQSLLFIGDEVHRAGAVGLGLYGDIQVDTIVAQGCRPVGAPLVVTRCEGNLLLGLDDRPSLDVLDEMFRGLTAMDRALFQRSPHLGLAMNPDPTCSAPGDYLVRNLIGVDRNAGVIGVGAILETGQGVRFHVRDAAASAADLEQVLQRHSRDHPGQQPAGAMLFSCLGRGEHLYGQADHDTELFHAHMGSVALGGFFCNGEIGPVHGRTYLHGYTSAFGLFRPRGWS